MRDLLSLRCIESGREYPLLDGLTIGREPACDIQLESKEVSRQHARIVVENDAIVIEDLDSTNGVKVAGRKLPRVRLTAGQLVVLGDRSLLVVDSNASADATLIGSHLPGGTGSVVVDDPEDESTTFRSEYALPAGWSEADHAAFGVAAENRASDLDMLRDLLAHRGISRSQAHAALMLLDEENGNRIFLLEREHTPAWQVGRGSNVHVCMQHVTISNHHATLAERGGQWSLKDEGSTNGTEVNGRRVENADLNPGDIIRFGSLSTLFTPID